MQIANLKLYFKQLFIPWKIITFSIATGTLTYVGTIANDPTWDIYVSLMMSSLTYLTSSFFVITFYRCFFLKKIGAEYLRLMISLILYYLSVSGSYDFYNLFILGAWPESSLDNFFISSSFYIAAGFFWGIDNEEFIGSFLHRKRKSLYAIASIFIGISFLYFGIFN